LNLTVNSSLSESVYVALIYTGIYEGETLGAGFDFTNPILWLSLSNIE